MLTVVLIYYNIDHHEHIGNSRTVFPSLGSMIFWCLLDSLWVRCLNTVDDLYALYASRTQSISRHCQMSLEHAKDTYAKPLAQDKQGRLICCLSSLLSKLKKILEFLREVDMFGRGEE